jgi:hypothetical protein
MNAPYEGVGARALERALAGPLGRVRLARGRGAERRAELLRRLRLGDAAIDDKSALALAELLQSLTYAVEDAEAGERRAKRTWPRW